MVSTDETITASSKNTKRQPTAQDDAITSQPDVDTAAGEVSELEKRKAQDGVAKFSRLGWKRLTILLMVTAIALGTLSLPAAFATLGMVLGVILTIVSGLLAIFAGLLVGQTKLKYPEIHDYADVGRVLFGKVGYEIFHFMCILQLLFLAGSHCLTGTTALKVITAKDVCSVYFGLASAAALFIISLPPSFAEVAILGYVDFASIVITIGITIIATGIQHDPSNPLTASDWSAWPKPGITSTDAFIAVLNLVFAYSFTIAQFSFMDEMHTPRDFNKSIWSLGVIQITMYVLTGALIYAFVGQEVQSPALLSAGTTVSRVAFGVAIPVIFISGGILIVTAGRMIHGRIYANSITRYVNTTKGWVTWMLTITAIVIVGWFIAEVIPIFSDLVALISSLLNSGFALYFPALMWFMLLREGKWNTRKNLLLGGASLILLVIGLFLLTGGTYAVIRSIVEGYKSGGVKTPFTCS
ncbi:unnamed protein product [Clonostachys rosea f. rosea IK726]|uniref:Amino acid transporter transmembrane domain-containing protein n=2 Tax=Bionectria ochroleuca TaxID=29856 RepID=A0A0B7KG93_BIOOC|nr:unnamed protein product [Clonostachys rosea f. rosea IK726]